MKNIRDLQVLINERATKRAIEYYEKTVHVMFNNGANRDFWKTVKVIGEEGEDERLSIIDSFGDKNDTISKKYIAYLTEKFIVEESKIFMEKVNSIEKQIADLLCQNS